MTALAGCGGSDGAQEGDVVPAPGDTMTAGETADTEDDAVGGTDDAQPGDVGAVGDVMGPGDPDGASEDTATPEDGSEGLLPRGEACVAHDDCASNWCVPTTVGIVCVDVCIETCAEDARCVRSDTGSSDEIYLCLPWDTSFPGTTDPGGGTDTVGGETAGADGTAADGTGVDGTGPDGGVDGAGPSDTGGVDGSGPLGDSDGDGIPDDEDLIPCLGFELLVYNQGVTSASIALNGATIFGADAFPTTLPLRAPINPSPGTNSLDLGGQLTGSPNDTLSLFVVSDDGRVWFETLFVRGSGPPRTYSAQFVIDVVCD